jgi:DNA modification methylase
VSELLPYARNARTHSDEQVSQLAASIKEFGFNNPVAIDADGMILCGHGRVMAAQKLHMAEVPTVCLSHLSDTQVKAYILADNKLALNAGWDNDMLKVELEDLKDLDFDLNLTGFSDEELKDILVEDPTEAHEDNFDGEPPEVAKSQLGDIWILGEHRLMCGDSTSENDVKALMQDEKADMCFTDPPYGVSYADKNQFLNTLDRGNRVQVPIKNDHMSVDDTSEFVYKAFCNIRDNLAEYSSYYITAPQGGELLMMMMTMMQKACIPLRHMLIWVKNNHVLGRCDYNYKHEPILFGWINKHKFYGKGEHKFSTWEIPKPVKNDLHPTMKPVALVENALLNSSLKGQICLDLFGGSGTTLIACEQLGRKARLMELDEHYCDVICQRYINLKKSDADVFLLRGGKKIPYKEVFS